MHRAGAWKKDAFVLLTLLAIPTLLTADILFGNTFYYRDLTRFFYGSDHVFREIVRAGELPLWNPFFAAGQPFAANPEFSVFYPPRWLVLLPDFRLGFNLQLLLHIHLALAGMYLLLRSMKLGQPAASFGALAFGIGGFTCSYLNIPPFLFTLAWTPWILLFARLLLARPSRPAFALTALCFGLQNLAGEPTGILQTGILIAAVLLYETLTQKELGRARFLARRGGLLAAALGAGVLLAAAQVFGTIDFVRDTVRADGLPFQVVKRWSMPPLRVLELFFPAFMGHKADSGFLYWGVTAYGSREGPYILDLYVGYLTALLALCGAVVRQKEWALWSSLAALSLLIAVGDHTPLLGLLHQAGVFRAFRYPEKFVLLAIVPLIIQSSISFDRLINGDRKTIRTAASISMLLAAAAASLLAFTFSAGYHASLRSFWAIPTEELTALVAAATRTDWVIAVVRGTIALLLLASLLRYQASRQWLALAALFILYDLGTTSNRDLPRLSAEYFDPPPSATELQRRPPSRLFHEADLFELEFGAPETARGVERYWFIRDGLYPKLPALWGIPTVLEADYDLTHLRPTRDLYAALLLATKARGGTVPPVLLQISGVGSVASHRDGRIAIQAVGPHPKFYFARRLVPYRAFEEFVAASAEGRWRPGDAFVSGQLPPDPGEGEIIDVSERFNSMNVEVRVARAALLVIGVTPHRYWSASIDGRPATLLPVNVGYQGLMVPSGARRVSLRYSNRVITTGLIVSGITFAALLLVLVAGLRPALDDIPRARR